MLLDPARVRKPKDKARCERMVPYVRESLFTGRDVATLAGWRSEAARWSVEVAGTSGHLGSPHYADQLPIWGAGELHYVPLKGDIAGVVLALEPK